jgi:protein O-mannosyl-transferase
MKAPRSIRPSKSFPPGPPAGANELLSPLTVWIAAAAMAAAVIAIYSPSLNFQFILDDHRFVGDPRVQSAGHLWEYFTSYVWSQVPGGPLSFYRPFFVIWMRLNFILNETSTWEWHLLSVAKHLAVAVLLGLVVWRLLRDRVAALVAGTLFAVHPAQTESVAWVTVPDPLMAGALLASFLLYLEYAEPALGRRRPDNDRLRRKSRKQVQGKSARPSVMWLFASLAAFMAALMAKETAIVWPAVLLVVNLIVPFDKGTASPSAASREEDKGLEARVLSALGQIGPFVSVTVVYLLLRFSALGGHLSPATQHLSWSTQLSSWPSTLWFYMKVLFWPIRSRAFADPTLAETFSLRAVALPALGVSCVAAVAAGGCYWAWRKAGSEFQGNKLGDFRRALVLAACLLVFPILLTLNLNALNPGDFLHGRYTYLPLTGLMILVAIGWHLSSRGRAIFLALAGTVALVFGVLTVQQESAWKDDLTVFTVAHQIAPRNAPVAQNLARAHVQVALGLDQTGRCSEAVPIFEDAIHQYPLDWYAWAGLGECAFKLNDLPKAEQSLRQAFALSHQSRVKEEWDAVRARMGLAPATE